MDIILDGSQIREAYDFHRILSEKLDFGPYYGNNMAALWDRLTTDVERPLRLIWRNAGASKAAMGAEVFDKIVQLLHDVETQDVEFGRNERFTFRCE